ncbi:hypothetical protein GTPT_0081 [Tatumella ptyseos ATCC 33301]|uniref:Uncharacterized protein n=1 Tax=Tatumella ptyseos ATCC 33301 TaxID=1005995 RepID=A0A085JPW2_9GAMM|nr:hypothetical protein GTPT_0081 [Tatumella ptyseos ATCC 33301]
MKYNYFFIFKLFFVIAFYISYLLIYRQPDALPARRDGRSKHGFMMILMVFQSFNDNCPPILFCNKRE